MDLATISSAATGLGYAKKTLSLVYRAYDITIQRWGGG